MSIRICIGTEPRTEIAKKVLEYSIIKNTNSDIEFHYLIGEDYYDRGQQGQGTGFSFLRFAIPEKFNYEGAAIYLDADMLVLTDIKELWNYLKTDQDNVIWCTYGNEKQEEAETSVMLINCEKAKGKIKTLNEIIEYVKDDKNKKRYLDIMKLRYLKPRPLEISKYWNIMDKNSINTSLKDFTSPKAKLLHYTSVSKQPWYIPNHPHADIWGKWFKRAYTEGYISSKEIKQAAKKYDVSNPRRPNGLHKYWLNYLKI